MTDGKVAELIRVHGFLYSYGLTTITVLWMWVVYRVLSGRWSLAPVFEGADRRPSTSKFQLLVWTIVALVAYLLIYLARASQGVYYALDEFPPFLLVAMGFSGVTAAAAKGITASYIDKGALNKPDALPAIGGPGAGVPVKKCSGMACLVLDDQGYPDLSKIQLVAWTLVAVVVYLCVLTYQVCEITSFNAGAATPLAQMSLADLQARAVADKLSLPDISPALMVLMGLGQGAYLGKKLVTTDTPRLLVPMPSAGRPGSEVTLTGQGLGEPGTLVVVTIDGEPIAAPVPVTEAQAGATGPTVKFRFPEKRASGADWEPKAVSIGVIASGQDSANRVPFTVILKPIVDRLTPNNGKAGTEITLIGQGIAGSVQFPELMVDGKVILDKPTAVNGNEVRFNVPTTATGTVQIGLKVDGYESATSRPFTVTA